MWFTIAMINKCCTDFYVASGVISFLRILVLDSVNEKDCLHHSVLSSSLQISLFQIFSKIHAIPKGLIEKVGFALYSFIFSIIYSVCFMPIVLHVP